MDETRLQERITFTPEKLWAGIECQRAKLVNDFEIPKIFPSTVIGNIFLN